MIDYRWGAGDIERNRKYAAELVALAPQVILANSTQAVAALLQATRTVPIVFVGQPDPVGAGFVNSLARPGGNITGFLAFEYSMGATSIGLNSTPTDGATDWIAPNCARRRRNRARRDGVRAIPEWRSDCDRGPAGGASSRCDHQGRGPAPVARGLRPPAFRHQRRPDLLWSRCRRSVPTGCLAGPRCSGGITDHRHARRLRRNLFEQLQRSPALNLRRKSSLLIAVVGSSDFRGLYWSQMWMTLSSFMSILRYGVACPTAILSQPTM